ncbi:hypothetical protein FJ251_09590 [bacterium]|nr:hypothetical protein [bacterium]
MRSTLALFLLLLAAAAAPALAEGAAAAPPVTVQQMEVVDDNEFRVQVEKTELDYHPRPEDLDDGNTDVERLLFEYAPLESFNPYLFDSERVDCPVIPDFGSRAVTRAPVTTFRTEFAASADVKHWRLDITDYRGEGFRRLEGDGVPPLELAWDGRSDHAEMLRPGFPYSFLFTIEDSGTNRYQYAGSTFVLPTLAYGEGKNLRIEAAGAEFFVTREAKPLPAAERRIDRLLREILEAPDRAIRVEAQAESAAVATARAQWLAERLEERLLLADGQVAFEGRSYKGNPPGRDGLLRVTLLRDHSGR